ncbi:MAG: peptide ABC transporter substrate-binding protein [Chloroflexia bacterium]|nr:peptide ABC transporter substrate-binding protein [Chloroflexia bacterium]
MVEIQQNKFRALFEGLKAGDISRRQFIQRSAALGVSMSVIAVVLQAPSAAVAAPGGAAGVKGGRKQDAAAAPSGGTESQTRGEGGELRIIQHQAPTVLNPHVSTGTKDYLAASLVLEPMMNYNQEAQIVPTLVTEVPSVENGGLNEELTEVTYHLKEGVTWSDGEPFTADDLVFTWEWIMNEENASVSIATYEPITSVEAVDDLTVKVTYAEPNANWFEPHTGTIYGPVLPRHILEAGEDAASAFRSNPIGTGPFKVDSFVENDQVIYSMNENFRDATKPFFNAINLKGGGDAASAARAVLQTGDFDLGWNLQVEPAVLNNLVEGGDGQLVVQPGANVERININFSDPNQEVDGQRSHFGTPHPFLTDLKVRQALNLACDRATIAREFYVEGEEPTANILEGIAAMDSPNTSWEFNLEQAAALLDEAGWTMDGDTRTKDGMELSMTYATSINPVRQKTQAVIKAAWEQLGIKLQLQQVDAGIFFDSSAGNEQTIGHFYTDINMFTNGASGPFPAAYMIEWYLGPDDSNVSQKENDWSGQNRARYSNPEFDALFDQVRLETDPEVAADLFIQMNDILINDVVMIPLVNRAADVYGAVSTFNVENIGANSFEVMYWNAANWNNVQ